MNWLKDISDKLSPGQPIYVWCMPQRCVLLFLLTALVFSRKNSGQFEKEWCFPARYTSGEQTARYVEKIMLRLTMIGAVYISLVCLLPEFLVVKWNVPFLLWRNVTVDSGSGNDGFYAQVQSYLMSHQYESLLKKANFKGGLAR